MQNLTLYQNVNGGGAERENGDRAARSVEHDSAAVCRLESILKWNCRVHVRHVSSSRRHTRGHVWTTHSEGTQDREGDSQVTLN